MKLKDIHLPPRLARRARRSLPPVPPGRAPEPERPQRVWSLLLPPEFTRPRR